MAYFASRKSPFRNSTARIRHSRRPETGILKRKNRIAQSWNEENGMLNAEL